MTETRVTGNHYRVFDSLNEDGSNHYKSLSFVTDASDVIFDNGANAQQMLGNTDSSIQLINTEIANLKKSVSDGKTLVANTITANGVNTAANATFHVLSNNIKTACANQYNAGIIYADGRVNGDSANYKTGYNSGYNAGAAAIAKGAAIFLKEGKSPSATLNLTGLNSVSILCGYAHPRTTDSGESGGDDDDWWDTSVYLNIDGITIWHEDIWTRTTTWEDQYVADISSYTGAHNIYITSTGADEYYLALSFH